MHDREGAAPDEQMNGGAKDVDGANGSVEEQAQPAVGDTSAALAEAHAQAEEYLEQARRARAELQNYRRRADAEMEQARRHAGERVISRMLPVVDDFHRALSAVPEAERSNPWIQGILLIERKLWSILESEGVKPIEAVGQPFDPSLHEAVSMESGGGTQVVEEYQRGYTLHDRVIRPAMVKVGQAQNADGSDAKPSDGKSS